MSDRYGRIPILILSQIGTAVSFFMLAFAPSVAFLYLARILDGITGGNIIVAQAYITDITPRERRTEALGYIFAVFGLGFIFGPVLGSMLSVLGPSVPYVVAGLAASLAVVILTWFTLDESLTAEERAANRSFNRGGIGLTDILRNQPLTLILLIAFAGQFGLGLLQGTFRAVRRGGAVRGLAGGPRGPGRGRHAGHHRHRPVRHAGLFAASGAAPLQRGAVGADRSDAFARWAFSSSRRSRRFCGGAGVGCCSPLASG